MDMNTQRAIGYESILLTVVRVTQRWSPSAKRTDIIATERGRSVLIAAHFVGFLYLGKISGTTPSQYCIRMIFIGVVEPKTVLSRLS